MWTYLIMGITGLAGYGLAWYYRNKAVNAERTSSVVVEQAHEIVTAYTDLKGKYSAAVKQLRVLQDEEAAQDYETASHISSADDAAKFLNDSVLPGLPVTRDPPKARVSYSRRATRPLVVLGFARRQRALNPR